MVTPGPEVHLFVIQHGLWGTPTNMLGLFEHFQHTLQPTTEQERIVLENSGEWGVVEGALHQTHRGREQMAPDKSWRFSRRCSRLTSCI